MNALRIAGFSSRLIAVLFIGVLSLACGDDAPVEIGHDDIDNANSNDATIVNNDGGDEQDVNETPSVSEPDEEQQSDHTISYYRNIKPLMDQHCTECHVPNGISPFSLQSYDEVAPLAPLLLASMESGQMPPWPPSDECSTFKHHRGVSEQELALFKQWIDEGRYEGDASEYDFQDFHTKVELGTPDYVVDPGFEYQPRPNDGEVDDYRCFVIDPQLNEDKYIKAFETLPGNSAMVHHVILYSIPEEHADRLEQLEKQDDSPGYRCFGGPRVSTAYMLSGWVPGTVPLKLDDGLGIRLHAGAKLVMQVHYNTVNDSEGTDRTTIDLHFTDGKARNEIAILPLADYRFRIQAGDPDAVASASAPVLPLDITIHGIAPHMHLLGTSIDVKAKKGSEEICLIDIPRWDFNWQGFYLYEEPLVVPANFEATLTCRYDNSPANQPDGREPTVVRWGDGTYDEMCLVYFFVQLPPGVSL